MITDLFEDFVFSIEAARKPDFIIGDEENPYMLRWWIKREQEHGTNGSLYIHKILRDDDDRALHCHPADSMSCIIKGTMREILPRDAPRILIPGDIVFRKAADRHRLEIINGPVWTLFAFGKKYREWGFHCEKGFVHWADFTDKTGSKIGKGCD